MTESLTLLTRKVLALALGLSVGLAITFFAGENPFHVLQILIRSAFGSRYDFGMTLFYSIPLVFTGLSVATAFQAGLFNIGAEGQLNVAAIAAAAVGMLLPSLPFPLAPLVGICAALLAGAFWGGIAGWIRAKRGGHEVIVTIMLNFIAAALCNWLTLGWLKNPESQYPETHLLQPAFLVSPWSYFEGAGVGPFSMIAVLMAVIMGFFFFRTRWGFQIRMVGQNEMAGQTSGISTARTKILAMVLAGALAGWVGAAEVLGSSGRYRLDFSPGYGFLGIAVALLGGSRPLGVVFSALLFGALHKGAADLDLETERVTREISDVLQAMIILFVSAESFWRKKR